MLASPLVYPPSSACSLTRVVFAGGDHMLFGGDALRDREDPAPDRR